MPALKSVLVLFAAFAASQPALADMPTRLVAVGANVSVDARLASLRYAETDAEKFAQTAVAVGLSTAHGTAVARSTSLRDLSRMIETLRSETRPPRQVEPWRFVFYFSGHADDRGLHFVDGFLSREQLHAMIDGLTAKTKVIVIDSCFSGSIAAKGVEQAPAFDLPRLDLDELSGTVFLTASSSRQLAYESDELGGSIFTHYLVKGMNGRGDANDDGLVTVDELYQYVYREMRLRSLTAPEALVQKPEIHADLRGSGALTIARPRSGRGVLVLDPGIMGTIHVASLTGLGTFEAYSDGSKPKEIPLAEGSYRAVIRRGTRVGQATVHVGKDDNSQLLASDFSWHELDGSLGVSKGPGSLAAAGLTGVVALRVAADRASTRGPQVEIVRELERTNGGAASGRIVLIRSLYQAGGASPDATVETYGGKAAVGLMVGPTGSFNPRATLGVGQGAEYQSWLTDDGKRSLSIIYPSVIFGLNLDLDASPIGGRSIALRYDADYVKDLASKGLRRRDVYVLGVSFNP